MPVATGAAARCRPGPNRSGELLSAFVFPAKALKTGDELSSAITFAKTSNAAVQTPVLALGMAEPISRALFQRLLPCQKECPAGTMTSSPASESFELDDGITLDASTGWQNHAANKTV
ncbi:hypothetical protein CQ016_12230 [Arthrobacter sp. MYb222]|nr:hypothetical protein CQ016_12230 [Arthrobacter sp. MYb222]